MLAYAETHESSAHEAAPGSQNGVLSPEINIILLTYVTFFILLAVLYKFAWKPILSILDARESTIRRSLEDAQKAREELAKVNEESKRLIAAADLQAKEIVERARNAAVEAAKVIERKAKEDAKIILGNAYHEINVMKEKAQMALRQESTDLAVGLAQKIIKENLTMEKQQKLIDVYLQEFISEFKDDR